MSTEYGLRPAPVAAAERIKTIDMIRGVALLGILLMNIPGFGLHWSRYFDILKMPQHSVDYRTFETMMILFEGTMRGLFSMLFGAGMILFTMNKADVPGGATVAEYYYRRLLWLMVFGLINAFIFLWIGDILFFYAFAGMLIFPFRNLAPSKLVLMALLCLSITLLKYQASFNDLRETRQAYNEAKKAEKNNRKLSESQKSAIAEWEGIEKNMLSIDSATIKKDLKQMHGSYGSVYRFLLPLIARDEINFLYHNNWDVLTMMFLGMAFFRWGFFSNRWSTQLYWLTLLIGYGTGFAISYFHFTGFYGNILQPGNYVDRFRISPYQLYDFKRIAISLGHASLVILLYRSRLVPWLLHALGCVGQMAFTNYLMQSIICSFYFDGFGGDMYNRLRFHELYYVVGCVWLFQLIFSPIWLRYFRFGPFEWLWRSLTYWQKQPMRRTREKPLPVYEEPQLAS